MARKWKGAILALLAGAVSACTLASPAQAFEPRVPETFFGISAPELWSLTERNKHAERDAQLDAMKAAGIDWVRVEIGWPEIEPAAPGEGVHDYRWRSADRLVGALAAREMELMAMPMATPSWAAGADGEAMGCGRRSEVAQSRAEDYAAFAEAIVRRYGVDGTFWGANPDLPRVPVTRYEIWNEANWNGFWCPEPDPELYATLAMAAADRIHGVDPNAQVILGGLAALQDSSHAGNTLRGMAAGEFLQRAVAHEPRLTSELDAVGFHPYDVDPAMNLALVGWLHRELAQIGLADAEIVLSEFGWRAGGLLEGTLTELLRADNYVQMTSEVARTNCGVSAVAAHTWQSAELDPLNPEHWYGLVSTLTGQLHPSGLAYRDQVALFEGRGSTPAPRDTLTVCGAALPDQDGDGLPDEDDDAPLDPTPDVGAGEEPPPPADTEELRTGVQRAGDAFFGVNVVQLPDDFTRLGAEYEAMSSARIGAVRQRIVWSYIEPVPPGHPEYAERAQWAWLDRLVLKMAGKGIGLQPSFGGVPAWVSEATFDADYAAFMTRFAQRYGAGGSFWAENGHLDGGRLAVRNYEVWQYGNLNAHSPWGTATAAAYAGTYVAVRNALRAVDGTASAVVSLGELGQTGRAGAFLRAMATAEPQLEGAVDGLMLMAEHSRALWSIEAVTAEARYALDDTGNGSAPIFLGFGAPTAGPGAMSETDRAQLFTDVASRAARGDCGVAGVFAHAWTTPEADATNAWHWFGIADKDDATLSPTAEAYRDVAASFRGYGAESPPTGAVHPCVAPAPDRDGDGTADPADPAPLDPTVSTPTATPPPAPVIDGAPASPTQSRTATFSLSAAGATGFQCKLDGGRFSDCAASPTFSNLEHGEHVLRARAVDGLGLVGPESVQHWTVDIVGPKITDLSGPGPISHSSRVEFTFGADDDPVSIACRLDGHKWEWCTSPKVYPAVGDGFHEFRVAAYDALGNLGRMEVVRFDVDTVPAKPEITAGPAQDAVVTEPRPSFSFQASGAVEYQCRFDSEAFGACSGDASHQLAADLANGLHTFAVRGVGEQGVTGEAVERAFTVDVPPPTPQEPGITWSRPISLSPPASPASSPSIEPRLAVDPSGNATFAWTIADGTSQRVQSRTRATDGTLSRVQILSRIGYKATSPQVAVDAGGNATFAWSLFDGTSRRIQTRTRATDGTLSPIRFLSRPGVDATAPQVAVDPSGNATFAWSLADGAGPQVQTRTLAPDGTLSDVRAVSSSGHEATTPQVVIDPNGNTTFAWTAFDGTNRQIQTRTLEPDGTLSDVQTLSPSASAATDPKVAVDPDGNATFAWDSFDGTTHRVQTRTRSAQGTLGNVRVLSGRAYDAKAHQVAVDPNGTATFAWSVFDGTNERIQTRAVAADGAVGSVRMISRAGQDATAPQVALAPDGSATFAWIIFDGTTERTQARALAPDGSLSGVRMLSWRGYDAESPQVAVDPNGSATVAWGIADSSVRRVQAAVTP